MPGEKCKNRASIKGYLFAKRLYTPQKAKFQACLLCVINVSNQNKNLTLSFLTCRCKSWIYYFVFSSIYQYSIFIAGFRSCCPECCSPSRAVAPGLLQGPGLLGCRDCGNGSILWPEVELQTTYLVLSGLRKVLGSPAKEFLRFKAIFLRAGLFPAPTDAPLCVLSLYYFFLTISDVECPWWLPAWSKFWMQKKIYILL